MNYLAKVSNYKGSQPLLGKISVGLGLITGTLSLYSYIQSFIVQSEVDYRKSQLAKPIVRLST
jgi:hypothetical protein